MDAVSIYFQVVWYSHQAFSVLLSRAFELFIHPVFGNGWVLSLQIMILWLLVLTFLESNNLFKIDPPTTEEIIPSLKRKRNGAASGPVGIPCLTYMKIPFLQHHLCLILQEMWPNFDLPGSRHGITRLIYKNGSNDEVSNDRPVTMTNTDGKIFLSVLATRSLSYMKNSGYYDLSIQKGFISDMAGCAEHTTVLSELLNP